METVKIKTEKHSARNPMKPSVVHQHTMLLLMIWQNMTKDVFFNLFNTLQNEHNCSIMFSTADLIH